MLPTTSERARARGGLRQAVRVCWPTLFMLLRAGEEVGA